MTKYLYIFEKPSARREGVKALGGDSGVFEGEEYATVNLIGHILQGYKPEEQAKDSYKETVFLQYIPQDLPYVLAALQISNNHLIILQLQ